MRQLILLFIALILDCSPPYGFPSAEYKQQVLSCFDYKTCESAYLNGLEVYKLHNCLSKDKLNFIYQVQEREYCVDQKMLIDITSQKMLNYKK